MYLFIFVVRETWSVATLQYA
uniref:Uncharacterized protein n=1 Tax=Rhizophora mucronata TaxID=61149 RepID=A0A2P2QXX7_RHIMU